MTFVSDSSGRFATSYVPECVVNEQIKAKAGIKNNYAYRMYLQRNAEKMIKEPKPANIQIAGGCDCAKCLLLSKKDFFKSL